MDIQEDLRLIMIGWIMAIVQGIINIKAEIKIP